MKRKERFSALAPRARLAARGARAVFIARSGRMRLIWMLILAYIAYALWTYAAAYGLARAFSALFSAWGLTSANLHMAPGWAQWIVANYGNIISVVSGLGAAALSVLLIRLYCGRYERVGIDLRKLGIGAGVGIGVVALSAALFLALDSMRLEAPLSKPTLGAEPLLLLVVYLVAALAEELFARALVIRAVRRALGNVAWARLAAWAASALALLLVTGGYALGFVGALNLLMMGGICAIAHDCGWASASMGLRFGWSWASVALFNFPGGNVSSAPVCALYSVSERWLTGDEGLICGLWMTLLLASALGALIWKKLWRS